MLKLHHAPNTRAGRIDESLAGRTYAIGNLSGADFMMGDASYLLRHLGCMPDEGTYLHVYVKRSTRHQHTSHRFTPEST